MGEPGEQTDDDALRAARESVITMLRTNGLLWPVVDFNGCERCFSPSRSPRRQVCGSCREVGRRNPLALDSLEAVTIATSTGGLERILSSRKDSPRSRDSPHLLQLAAPLTSYLEAHRDDLGLDDDAVLFTAVPSSSEVIADALAIGGQCGWFDRVIEHTGRSTDPDRKQRYRDHVSRQTLTHADWLVESDSVEGRDVVLLDDLMTSGASLHSYAKALKKAGARRIRGVVLIRHTGGYVYGEGVAAIRARDEALAWSPQDRWAASLTGTLDPHLPPPGRRTSRG